MTGKVARIVDPKFKEGQGKNGPWTMMKVTLEDGRTVTGFDEVSEGQEVEVYQRGEYWNYKKMTQATKDKEEVRTELSIFRNEIMTALEALGDKIDSLQRDAYGALKVSPTEPPVQSETLLDDADALSQEDMKDIPF